MTLPLSSRKAQMRRQIWKFAETPAQNAQWPNLAPFSVVVIISIVLITEVISTNYFDLSQRASQKGKPSKDLLRGIKQSQLGGLIVAKKEMMP